MSGRRCLPILFIATVRGYLTVAFSTSFVVFEQCWKFSVLALVRKNLLLALGKRSSLQRRAPGSGGSKLNFLSRLDSKYVFDSPANKLPRSLVTRLASLSSRLEMARPRKRLGNLLLRSLYTVYHLSFPILLQPQAVLATEDHIVTKPEDLFGETDRLSSNAEP